MDVLVGETRRRQWRVRRERAHDRSVKSALRRRTRARVRFHEGSVLVMRHVVRMAVAMRAPVRVLAGVSVVIAVRGKGNMRPKAVVA